MELPFEFIQSIIVAFDALFNSGNLSGSPVLEGKERGESPQEWRTQSYHEI